MKKDTDTILDELETWATKLEQVNPAMAKKVRELLREIDHQIRTGNVKAAIAADPSLGSSFEREELLRKHLERGRQHAPPDATGDDVFLSTGRRLRANRGIIGISALDPDELFEGYDGHLARDPAGPLTSAERHELAERMVWLWRAWATRGA